MLVKPGMVHSPMTAGLPDSPLFAEPEAIATVIDRGLARHSAASSMRRHSGAS